MSPVPEGFVPDGFEPDTPSRGVPIDQFRFGSVVNQGGQHPNPGAGMYIEHPLAFEARNAARMLPVLGGIGLSAMLPETRLARPLMALARIGANTAGGGIGGAIQGAIDRNFNVGKVIGEGIPAENGPRSAVEGALRGGLQMGGASALSEAPGLALSIPQASAALSRYPFAQQIAELLAGGNRPLNPREIGGNVNSAHDLQFQALRPNPKDLAADPNLVMNSLERGVPVSSGGRLTATQTAERQLSASHAAENQIAEVHPTTRTWSPQEILQKMRDQINQRRTKNETKGIEDNPEWKKMEEDFLSRFEVQPTPREVPEYPRPQPRVTKYDMRRQIGGSSGNQQRGFPMGEQAAEETRMLEQQVRGAAQRVQRSQGAQEPPKSGNFDVQDMLAEKRKADEAVMGLHKQIANRKTGDTVVDPSIQELFDKTRADVIRGELRAAVPRLGRQMQQTSEILAQRRANFRAEARPDAVGSNVKVRLFPPGVSIDAPASRTASALSRKAFDLYRRDTAPAAPLLPRFLPAIGYLNSQ